jgi:hypothetical protein
MLQEQAEVDSEPIDLDILVGGAEVCAEMQSEINPFANG